MVLLTQLKAVTASLSAATALTFPLTNAGYAVTALQVFKADMPFCIWISCITNFSLNQWLMTWQVFITSASYFDDATTSAGYSKFSHEKPASMAVSGKTAMLMIYVPSVLFLLNYLRPFGVAFSAGELTGSLLNMGSVTGALVNNGRECLVAGMLLFHFAKRVAETLFLHKYSSKQTDGVMGACIGVYYTLTCLLITSCMVRQSFNSALATLQSDQSFQMMMSDSLVMFRITSSRSSPVFLPFQSLASPPDLYETFHFWNFLFVGCNKMCTCTFLLFSLCNQAEWLT